MDYNKGGKKLRRMEMVSMDFIGNGINSFTQSLLK